MYNTLKQELTLIDFGLCNKYLTQYLNHIPFRNTKRILGTPLYASNNALLGKGNLSYFDTNSEESRRDDIESLVYILIYCYKGTLPWKGELSLEFLKSYEAKSKIIEWRDPDGELCQEMDRNFES